jgi:hypothetical protein
VYRRSWAEGTATDGSRAGWSKEQSNPKLFVQATVYLAELAGDVGARFVEAVESRILGTHDLRHWCCRRSAPSPSPCRHRSRPGRREEGS